MMDAVGSPLPEPGPEAIVEVAEHFLRTDFEDLPRTAVVAAKRQLTDTLGVALAGRAAPGAAELCDFTVEMGGRREAGIWGMDARVPAQDAARINATMAHALDYDDDYERGFVHPAVITVPSALVTADLVGGVSGRELITAIALGADIACRLADSARPGTPPIVHGWHNTSLYGFFSAALISGRLLGLTRDQLVSAAGIAFHQAAGNSQAHLDGALTKRMGPGFASYGGVLAARLAQRGVRGATNVLEGSRGFYSQYHGSDYSREALLGGLGATFLGPEIALKPWPSCRGTHTAIEAALALATEAGDVEDIVIASGPAEYDLLDVPLKTKRSPASVVDAQFSNPWVVAAALTDRRVALEHFTDRALARPDLLGMTGRIQVELDESLQRAGGGPGATRLVVRLKDGRILDKTVAYAAGEPAHPMSDDDVHSKFQDCLSAAGLQREPARSLLGLIEDLEGAASSDELTAALAGVV